MDDKSLFEELGVGFEWLDQNYDGLDETAKAAFDKLTHGVTTLIWKYGVVTGVNRVNAAADFVSNVAMVMAGALIGYTAPGIYDMLMEWRKTRLSKTETTDSE